MLKAVVDMMKHRYTEREYDPLNLEEILAEIDLTDLKTDTRQWLHDVRMGKCVCVCVCVWYRKKVQ